MESPYPVSSGGLISSVMEFSEKTRVRNCVGDDAEVAVRKDTDSDATLVPARF